MTGFQQYTIDRHCEAGSRSNPAENAVLLGWIASHRDDFTKLPDGSKEFLLMAGTGD